MTLSITAMPDPDRFFDKPAYSGPQAYIGDLEDYEWDAIFYDTLHCPVALDDHILPEETVEEWHDRFSRKFRQAIPDYPMLAEIWNPSFYVSYGPEEIGKLRGECQRVMALTTDERALSGLQKLLAACDEASGLGYSILLIPD